jgi:hypothetical protein
MEVDGPLQKNEINHVANCAQKHNQLGHAFVYNI